ncbi:MAG: M23 family metallopeptidase [Puia sp.]|nr:M23 family metallopeptidase [Puia sp.]
MKPFILVAYSLFPIALLCSLLSITRAQVQPQKKPNFRSGGREADRTLRDLNNARLEQQRIVVKYEKNSRGEYVFLCENRAYCNYIVEVSFTEFENLQSDVPLPARMTVPPGTSHLFVLRRISETLPVRLHYHHNSVRGCTNPRPDTAFTYLLPVPPGRETQVYELHYIAEEYGGESVPKGWYALELLLHSGDTVFAARSGRVTETRDQADLADSGYRYAKEENFVEISHNDCTFGRYTVFRDSGIFVQPGDWVVAGQPLGIAGGDKYAGGPQVRFSVRYNLEQDVLKDGMPTDKKHAWAYVPLKCWTKDKGAIHLKHLDHYTSEHPAAIITQEMTKKEANKWMEDHKNG